MIKRFLFIAIVLAVVGSIFMINGCVFEKSEVPVITDTCTNFGKDTMSYQLDIVPILSTYCTAAKLGVCHQTVTDGGIGFDYTTYAGINAEVENGNLESRVIKKEGQPMPPAGSQELSPCDVERLQVWIDRGAPDN